MNRINKRGKSIKDKSSKTNQGINQIRINKKRLV